MSTRIPYSALMTDLTDDMFLVLPNSSDSSPAAPTLSFSRSPTVLLTFAGNRSTRSASRAYSQEFGIGAMDWRMLVMLTREPGSSVSHAARTIGIDKAAVSRSLHRLQDSGLVSGTAEGGDLRRKDWVLTKAGQEMHARILARALDRQKATLSGFSPSEVAEFTSYLSRFLTNLEALDSD